MTLNARTGDLPALTPNWREGVQIEYEFKTEITPHHDGTEQREAMRSTPRQRLTYTAMLKSDRMARFRADIAYNMDKLVSVPIPWRRVEVLSVAANVLTVAETPFWAVAGARVVLVQDGYEETADVESVGASTITLSSPPINGAPAGTRVFHSMLGRFETGTQFEALTNSVWEGEVAYALDPGADPLVAPTITPDTFETVDIFGWKPNWRQEPQITFDDQRDLVDFDRGLVAGYNPVGFITEEISLTFLGRSQQETEELIAFFLSRYGRQIAFWMPTYMQELEVVGVGSTYFDVDGLDAYDAYLDSKVYNVVHFDGQYRRVTNVQPVSGTTRFTVAAWDVAPEIGDYLCWVPLWRMSTDKLIVEWLTSGVAEMKLSMQTVPNEAPT